jgi:cytoskeletal protein RodZ
MQPKILRDQRGVAMIFELLLVAAVLLLVGFAVYQANHSKTAATPPTTAPASNTASDLAASAAATTIQDSATDASLSAAAESASDEVSATDSDVSNLGGSSANAF